MKYTELQVTSNFSFLRGASHPDELMAQAFAYGYKAMAVTDRNTVAGIVRAHVVAKTNGIRLIVGCRLDLEDGPSLLAYPTDKAAYTRLSALLTLGNRRAEKGECHLRREDVYSHGQGMKFIAVPPPILNELFDLEPGFEAALKEYKDAFGRNLYLAASNYYRGDDAKRLYRLSRLSARLSVPLLATNDVHYHHPARRQLQDVLTCIREKCTIVNAGLKLNTNAELYMKRPEEMARLFKDYPDALRRTQHIQDACQFSLDELRYEYPDELTSEGRTPQEELVHLVWQGAVTCFGRDLPAKVKANIEKELSFIGQVNYAPYFLTVYDIVRFARSRGILCQGRGSAANSTVCYCLGITSVDPSKFDLLFERFISSARNEPPDIDVDFEHERREEVIQYIYDKYGRDRAAIVATVTQERQKGAIRDVGKAMGLSVDTVNRLSAAIWDGTDEWFDEGRIVEQGLDPADPQLRKVVDLSAELLGFPRQLGMHTGGFVITKGQLSDLCPIMNARMEDRTTIEWNKDDIDALGLLKIDVLGLGMLTCIRKCFELAKTHYDQDFTLANIPQDDPAVYDMICLADTIGVFQIESRAQMSMLPRLRPRCFYDLVIEVAIIRPGPIQGDMVHPYLRRRNGEEPVEYPSKELEKILGRTLGVPLFQEQAMRIAIVAAGFTPAEADELRRGINKFQWQKFGGLLQQMENKLVNGMLEKGYTRDFAKRIFSQLEGFGSYGFPESHAASFALLVYVSSWLKCHYPDVFACGLLNSLPMGFYQPAQIVIDARKHDVEVRPVDINHSGWDNALEERAGQHRALRLGFRQIKGVKADDVERLVERRGKGYRDVASLHNAGISPATLERLADADAFRSIGLDRRKALWEVTALGNQPAMLFAGHMNDAIIEPDIVLPVMTKGEHVIQDYASLSLSLKAHPVSFVREKLQALKITAAVDLKNIANGKPVKVAGLTLVRQRPATSSGICFATIEDETDKANIVIFENIFNKFRKAIVHARLILIEGTLQQEDNVIHVIAKQCHDISYLLRELTAPGHSELPLLVSNADEVKHGIRGSSPSQNFVPAARNFR